MFTIIFHRNCEHLQILQETIAGVLTDPYFEIATKEALTCLEEAKSVVHTFSQPDDTQFQAQQSFAAWLYKSLAAIVSSAQVSAQKFSKEKMWIKFHELTSSLQFSEKWELFASELGIRLLSPLLYQHITGVIFERIIENKLTPVFSATDTLDDVIEDIGLTYGLTYGEENAVHYVGGYVIRQLKSDV